MPKLNHIQRGAQRLIFNNASVLDVQSECTSDSFSRFGSNMPTLVAGPTITTVRFVDQPSAVYSEAIDIDSIRERVNGRGNGAINYDAVLLLEQLETANSATLRLTDSLANERRDYEASKNLWRKRYTDQGDHEDDFEDYR